MDGVALVVMDQPDNSLTAKDIAAKINCFCPLPVFLSYNSSMINLDMVFVSKIIIFLTLFSLSIYPVTVSGTATIKAINAFCCKVLKLSIS